MKDRSVCGVVRTTGEADDLVAELLCSGLEARDVSIVFGARDASSLPLGLLRLVAGVGSFVVSGVGPIVSGGPATSAFAATGSAQSGLVRLGMSARDAADYECELQQGHVVVCVHAERDTELMLASSIFMASGAGEIVVTAPRPTLSVVQTA